MSELRKGSGGGGGGFPSEASRMLEAALEQMDGIIQGAKYELPQQFDSFSIQVSVFEEQMSGATQVRAATAVRQLLNTGQFILMIDGLHHLRGKVRYELPQQFDSFSIQVRYTLWLAF
jgi:hypothetical protein